jgi:hypothetical protein
MSVKRIVVILAVGLILILIGYFGYRVLRSTSLKKAPPGPQAIPYYVPKSETDQNIRVVKTQQYTREYGSFASIYIYPVWIGAVVDKAGEAEITITYFRNDIEVKKTVAIKGFIGSDSALVDLSKDKLSRYIQPGQKVDVYFEFVEGNRGIDRKALAQFAGRQFSEETKRNRLIMTYAEFGDKPTTLERFINIIEDESVSAIDPTEFRLSGIVPSD